MQGRKDINDEEKLNKGNKEEIKQTDNENKDIKLREMLLY